MEPGRDQHDVDAPARAGRRRRRRGRSATRVAARRCARSTRRAEPILTTIRRASRQGRHGAVSSGAFFVARRRPVDRGGARAAPLARPRRSRPTSRDAVAGGRRELDQRAPARVSASSASTLLSATTRGLSARPCAIGLELAHDGLGSPRRRSPRCRRRGAAAPRSARHGRGTGRRCRGPRTRPRSGRGCRPSRIPRRPRRRRRGRDAAW